MGASAEQMLEERNRRIEARAKGYEPEMCSECCNFTLVRNGTSMKCDTCGTTTGDHRSNDSPEADHAS